MERRRKSSVLRALCPALLSLCAMASGKVIYVDADANTPGNGLSWASAYTCLQDALADAGTAEKPVEIRVAEGMYRPDQGRSATKGDRNSVFRMRDGVALRGGFAGVRGADPNAWDPKSHKSILSGDLLGGDVWSDATDVSWSGAPPTYGDNSWCVVDASLTDRTAVLDGFQIEGATFFLGDRPFSDWWARLAVGGLYIHSGSPSVSHCRFIHNPAPGVVSASARGAVFSECQFASNRFTWGGAIFNSLGTLVILGCDFTSNVASGGGAIGNKGGTIVVDGSEFRNNTAYHGGAIDTAGGRVLLTQCGFLRNAAPLTDRSPIPYGGALYGDEFADVALVNCTFQGNTARASAGAIWVGSGTLTINACRFLSNRAEEAYGGVILIGGAASVSISGSAFIGNEARYGGSAISGGAELVCERCIFAGNRAKSGGAVYFTVGTRVLLNQCTTQGNRADYGSTLFAAGRCGVQVKNSILWDAKALELWGSAELSVAYSDTYEPQPGEGNISLDPLFARAGYWDPNGTPADPNDDFWVEGDYHLRSRGGRWNPLSQNWVKDDVTSLCINAGDPKSPVGDEPEPNGGRIDVGAYGGTIEASKSY
jgi:hypothetical protein